MPRHLLLVLALLLPLAGCAPRIKQVSTKEALENPPFLIQPDDLGRTIELTAPAKRVVIIGPGAAETLFAIGAGDTLVGRDQVVDFPEQAKAAPVVGNFQGPFTEKVAALNPDLVIMQGETWDAARVEDWQRKCGAPVAALTSSNLDGVASSIEKIGGWVGKLPAAVKLADKIRSASTMAKPTKVRAMIEIQRSPFWTAGGNTLVGEVLSTAFVNSPSADWNLTGYKQISLENLYTRPPDVLIVTDRRPLRHVLPELRRSPALSKLKCIQQGRVIVMDGDWILRPGPRLVDGIRELNLEARAIAGKLKQN